MTSGHGFAASLRAVGRAAAAPDLEWGDPELPRSVICPRLRSTYSPRVWWKAWAPVEGGPDDGARRSWARVWLPDPEGPALGSSLAPNPNRPPRYGLKGMPAAGRKSVWRALALLEDRRACLSFWTITLPPRALDLMGRLGTLPVFQDRIRKLLVRMLRRAGLPDLVVGVAELQPKRTRASGRPCPHWHIVFVGKKSGFSDWSFEPAELDEVIAVAAAGAGLGRIDVRSAGRVEPVYKSVRAYMSKYMTKGSGDCSSWVGSEWEELIPRQWWFWTRAMREWVELHVFPLDPAFVLWVHEYRAELQGRGLASFRLLDLPDPRAPATWEVNWLSVDHFASLLAVWQLARWDDDFCRRARLECAYQAVSARGRDAWQTSGAPSFAHA